MIPLLVLSLAQVQTEVLGTRSVAGQPVQVRVMDQAAAEAAGPWLPIGEDFVAAGSGKLLSLRESYPHEWLKRMGPVDPQPAAVKLPVAVRIFTRLEQGPGFLKPSDERPAGALNRRRGEFDDDEMARLVEGLAATEMVLERATNGLADVQWTIVVDPTPLRGYGESPIGLVRDAMMALTRESSWENQAGAVSNPFWGSLAIYPGRPDAAEWQLMRTGLGFTPRAPVVGMGLQGFSVGSATSEIVAAMENLLAQRAVAQGFGAVGSLPWWADGAYWAQLGSVQEPDSKTLASRIGRVPGPNGLSWSAPANLDIAKSWPPRLGVGAWPAGDRAEINPDWLTPDQLEKAQWTADGAGKLSLPLPGPGGIDALLSRTFPPRLHEHPREPEMRPGRGGSLQMEPREGGGFVLTHTGGEPFGRIPLAWLPAELAQQPILAVRLTVKGSFEAPLGLALNGEVVGINAAAQRLVGGQAWVKEDGVETTFTAVVRGDTFTANPLSLDFVIPSEPGLSRSNRQKGQALEILSLSISVPEGTGESTPEPVVTPPVATLDRATPVNVLLQALNTYQQTPDTAQTPAVELLTTHADPFVSSSALWALALQGTEASQAKLKYALEIGPFEHNRQAAAEILARTDFDLVRPLTTMMMAGEWSAREAQARALTRYAEKNSEAAVGLILLLTDPEPAVRLRAAQGIPLLGELAQRRLLYAAVNDPSEMVRATAYTKLLNAPNASIAEEARRGIGDESAVVRAKLYQALGAAGQESFQALIKRGLQDRSPSVRVAAVDALAICPGPVTREDVQLLSGDPAPLIQQSLKRLAIAKGFQLEKAD